MFLQAYRTFVSLHSTKCLHCSSVKLFHISWKWTVTVAKQIAGQTGDWVRLWVGWAQYPIHVCRGGVSHRTQRPRCEIGHSPTSSDKVANEWRCTSIPFCTFMAWRNFTRCNNFTFPSHTLMTTEKGWSKYVADILSVKYIKVKVGIGGYVSIR